MINYNKAEKFLDIIPTPDGISFNNHISTIYRSNILEGLELENIILSDLVNKKTVNIQIEGSHYLIKRVKRLYDIDENLVTYVVEVTFLNSLN